MVLTYGTVDGNPPTRRGDNHEQTLLCVNDITCGNFDDDSNNLFVTDIGVDVVAIVVACFVIGIDIVVGGGAFLSYIK
jgi:hypothetical protein